MRDLLIGLGVVIMCGIILYVFEHKWEKEKENLILEKDKLQSQLLELKRSNDSIVFYISKQITEKDKTLDNIASKAISLKPKYEYIKDIKPEYDDSLLLLNGRSIINYPMDR